MSKIVIVIPFFKIAHFNRTLDALARQTDRDFILFVGNDASFEEARLLCNSYSNRIKIVYHRFSERLGGRDVVAQWSRCLHYFLENHMTVDPEWIWFVPDDDLPSEDCIKEIRAAASIADRVGANVIHIPCVLIDGFDKHTSKRESWPSVEASDDFYLQQLKGSRMGLSLGNAVFRYSAFHRTGGFISLPRAWGSDHATVLSVAGGGPIVTLPSASFYFRMSGLNISSDKTDSSEKLEARVIFAQFLKKSCPSWYVGESVTELLLWFYYKSEYYACEEWGFKKEDSRKLFQIAEICGAPRSKAQKLTILFKGYVNKLKRNVGLKR